MMTRRDVLTPMGASLLAAPLGSFAQPQTKIWRVGFLATRRIEFVGNDEIFGAFQLGMRELGYVEGKNLTIEWRSAENRNERLPALAAELVNLKVDVIVAVDTFATAAAKKATAAIPIVMGNVSDPVGKGFIKSLARPGGNITGQTNIAEDIHLKHLEMLLAIVPKLTRVAVMQRSSDDANSKALERLQAEGEKRGVKIVRVEAGSAPEIDQAIARARQQNADALLVWSSPLFIQQRNQIAALTAKHRLPAISIDHKLANAGVLMSYGPNTYNQYRRAATYVDKIFKGARPADLPVEQPTVFELVINGKTAKALGLTIPQALLISANEVLK